MKAYSRDIRLKVVKAYENNEGSQRQIAARFAVSLSFVRDLLKQYRETGSLDPKPHAGGQSKKISHEGLSVLHELLAESPGATLDELCEHYERRCQIRPSRATMHRTVRQMKAARKKK